MLDSEYQYETKKVEHFILQPCLAFYGISRKSTTPKEARFCMCQGWNTDLVITLYPENVHV